MKLPDAQKTIKLDLLSKAVTWLTYVATIGGTYIIIRALWTLFREIK